MSFLRPQLLPVSNLLKVVEGFNRPWTVDYNSTVITDLNNLPALLTVDETASLLRTTRAAIYGMAERGRLAGITRVGRRLLVNRDALLKSLFEGRAPSPRGTRR